ncbi:MAG: hypothetical protein ACQEQL_03160 [Pseudomonadota bacterium]
MTNRFYRIVWIVILIAGLQAGLTACVSSPPAGEVAVDTYEHLQALALDVADVEIRDRYSPPMTAPFVEHRMINPPYNAAYNMMNHAFKPTGANNVIELHIIEASVRKTEAEDSAGGFQLWQTQRDSKYNGQLVVEAVLKRSVPPYNTIGQATVTAKRSLTAPENLSLLEREQAINRMMENMVDDLRQGLLSVFDKKFSILLAKPMAGQ